MISQKHRYIELKRVVMEKYGYDGIRCSCCGEDEYNFLTIDHIYGQIGIPQKDKKAGQNLYHYLKKNPLSDQFQILCYNCNLAKGARGECPHKSEYSFISLT